jgi:hypothetical protein
MIPDGPSPPAGEAEAIRKVVDVSLALLDRDAKPVPRDQHPKHHGLVRAEFQVDPAKLPNDCRVGLFKEPRSFQAVIRLSNGGQHDDRQPDAHGMAIKLVGVDGKKVLEDEADATTHDFVLVDNPVFFLPDAIAYGAFSGALAQAKGKAPSAVRAGLFFLPAKPRELVSVTLLYFLGRGFKGLPLLLKFVSKRLANPLTTRYWSTTPYRLGPRAVKYSAIPDVLETRIPQSPSKDYLREAMAALLNNREAGFTFAVQFYKDDRTTPIEDATVDWPEGESEFVPVARILIRPQDFDTEERRAFCEHLSFTPWHALPEHEPLGGINRTRRDVYSRLSAERHKLNQRPRQEPTLEEIG